VRKQANEQRSKLFGDDASFQQNEFRAERISWVVMTIVIVSALAGLLGGGGPFARDSKTGIDSSSVSYDRFARHSSPMTLDVNVGSGSERQVRLRLSDEYLTAMNVKSITPAPTSTALGDKQQILVFDRSAPPVAVTIRFQVEPMVFGLQRGWVAIDNAAPISFAHFIYP